MHVNTVSTVYFGSWLSQTFYVNNDSHMFELSPKLNDWSVIQLLPVLFLLVVK